MTLYPWLYPQKRQIKPILWIKTHCSLLPSIWFSVLNSFFQQLLILRHFGRSQQKWRVGCRIGRFVLRDGWKRNKKNELRERRTKDINNLSLSYFRSRLNQRRLSCTFWAVQVWRPFSHRSSQATENRMQSHTAEPVIILQRVHSWVRHWLRSAAFLIRKRNKMADGGDLTSAAATGDLKVWYLNN